MGRESCDLAVAATRPTADVSFSAPEDSWLGVPSGLAGLISTILPIITINTMADQIQELVDTPSQFVKEGLQFVNKCQKRKCLPLRGPADRQPTRRSLPRFARPSAWAL